MQNIHCRCDTFCEPIIVNLGLAGCGVLLSKDAENCLYGVAGLKSGKERMRGEVFLGFTSISIQSSFEKGRNVEMKGECGGPGGDSGSGDANAGPGSWERPGPWS